MTERWATFDCYGTLIDWMGGIRSTLGDLWTEAAMRVAHREGLDLQDDDREALGDSLPTWPPFAEVPGALAELRTRGWRLAILSNTDPDLLDASLEAIGGPVDPRIPAAQGR